MTCRSSGFVEDPEKAKKVTEFEAKDRQGVLVNIRQKNQRYKRYKASPSKNKDSTSTPDSIEIDDGDDPAPQQTHEAYAVFYSAFNNSPISISSADIDVL